MNTDFEKKYKLPITKENLVDLLNCYQITFDLFEHEPLNTVKQSKVLQNLIFPNVYISLIKYCLLKLKKLFSK